MSILKIKYFFITILMLFSAMFLVSCGEDPINGTIQSNDPVFNMDKFEENIRTMLRGQTTGYVYALNQNGQLKKSGDTGFARIQMDGGVQQSPSRRMNIASLTKTITAVAVLQLLERRGLSIDSTITPWLPADWTLGPNVDTLRFRDLLTHRTGFNSANSNFNNTLSFSALRDSVETGVVNPTVSSYLNMNFALFRVIIPALWKGLSGSPSIGEINATSASFFYRLYIQQEIFDKIGAMNVDCVNPPSQDPTLFYTANISSPGVDYGNWTMICGGGGFYLSAIDLANFMANIRYNNTILSESNRQIMDANYLGWREGNARMFGTKGEYFNHGGAITMNGPTGGSSGNMLGLIVKYPNNVEAVLMTNSDIANGSTMRQILTTAYDNAWE